VDGIEIEEMANGQEKRKKKGSTDGDRR